MKFKQIKEGWMNSINYEKQSPETKAMAEARSKFCLGDPDKGIPQCPHLTYSKTVAFAEKLTVMVSGKPITMTEQIDKAEGFACGMCGCGARQIFVTKDKKCPIGKW